MHFCVWYAHICELWFCLYMYMCGGVCAEVWRAEVHIRCLLPRLFTVSPEVGSLTAQGAPRLGSSYPGCSRELRLLPQNTGIKDGLPCSISSHVDGFWGSEPWSRFLHHNCFFHCGTSPALGCPFFFSALRFLVLDIFFDCSWNLTFFFFKTENCL